MCEATLSEPVYSSLAADPDLAEIVEMFVEEMPDRLAAVSSAWSTGNLEELGRLAHQMKGAAGSYGFDVVTPYAAKLEKSVRGGEDEATIQLALNNLLSLCNRVSVGTGE
jgi:HPt (histidine-containing phosphotransfer) domain-containing protein